jgi:hypothetical protein
VFAEELAAPGAPPTRAAALEALVSFEAWDQLRTSQRLSATDATEVLCDAAVALLA